MHLHRVTSRLTCLLWCRAVKLHKCILSCKYTIDSFAGFASDTTERSPFSESTGSWQATGRQQGKKRMEGVRRSLLNNLCVLCGSDRDSKVGWSKSVICSQSVCEIGKYFWGGHWLSCAAAPMHSMGPDSAPTPDPLSLCHDDINPIVTCFNAVIKIVLKRIFVFFLYILSFVTANFCPMVWHLKSNRALQSVITQICSWKTKIPVIEIS